MNAYGESFYTITLLNEVLRSLDMILACAFSVAMVCLSSFCFSSTISLLCQTSNYFWNRCKKNWTKSFPMNCTGNWSLSLSCKSPAIHQGRQWHRRPRPRECWQIMYVALQSRPNSTSFEIYVIYMNRNVLNYSHITSSHGRRGAQWDVSGVVWRALTSEWMWSDCLSRVWLWSEETNFHSTGDGYRFDRSLNVKRE